MRREIKHKIIESNSKDKLVHLKFNKTEVEKLLKWEHSKEFEYNNQMFDVVEVNETNDSIEYWCWWDNKETELNKQLSSLLFFVYDSSQQTKDTKNRIEQFLKGFYFLKGDFLNHTHWNHIIHETNFLSLLSFGFINNFSPPPQY